MTRAVTAKSFYQASGTLEADAPSYVQRQADHDLLAHVIAGDFCYVLTPRQMGKSRYLPCRTDRVGSPFAPQIRQTLETLPWRERTPDPFFGRAKGIAGLREKEACLIGWAAWSPISREAYW